MTQNLPSDSSKKIVILGGSYAGISTAHYLLKHAISVLPSPESYEVVLVSPSSKVLCRPACPRALISDEILPQDKLFVNIPKQFEQYPEDNFSFIQGTATELAHTKKTVSLTLIAGTIETIHFYSLVIATGSSTPSPLLGLNRDDNFLRTSWESLRKALPDAKSIVIAGGGPSGIETAGELGEYLNGRAGWFASKLENPKVSITVIGAGSKILPILRPSLGKKAEDLLSKVGVTVIKNARVMSVIPAGSGTDNVATNTEVTLEDGTTLDTDIYIPAFGMKPNTNFIDKTLLAADNRVKTNPTTLRVDDAGSHIYAIGDASSAARPAVHNVLDAVPVLCANIKRDLLLASEAKDLAAAEDRLFKEDTRETQLVPIGKSKGVGALMGYQVPSFFVWLIKGRDYWLWTTGNLWNGKQWAKES